MSRHRWIITAIAACLIAASPCVASAATTGLLRQPVKSVLESSQFFQFYHLAVDSVGTESDGKQIYYCRPSGGPLRDLAQVVVGADRNRNVYEVALTLARSFVDDPKNGKYARDITAYFLRWVPAPDEAQELSRLSSRILNPSSGVTLTDPDFARSFAIFNGKNDSVFRPLSTKTMMLFENDKTDRGTRVLSIFLSRI